MNAGHSRLTLSKQDRLRHSRQFRQVYIRGRRFTGPHLSIIFIPNQLSFNRLGLAVKKKRFRLSATRHYIQRRLREAYRLNKTHFLPGYDIIISAQRFNKDKIRFVDIKRELLALARQANLLKATTLRRPNRNGLFAAD